MIQRCILLINVLLINFSRVTLSSPLRPTSNENRIIIHDSFRHRFDIDQDTHVVTFLEASSMKLKRKLLNQKRSSKGLFGSKNKKKAEEDITDKSTDAFKKLNQKEIEELSNKVTESRNNMATLAVAHEQLEQKLEAALKNGGKKAPIQTSTWVS